MITVYVGYYNVMDTKVIAMWSLSYRMFELRSCILKDCDNVETLQMSEDEFYKFEQNNSDTRLDSTEINAGASDIRGGEVTLTLPLTYTEVNDIEEFFDDQLASNPGIYMPSDIFKSKYADALSSLGMDMFYALNSSKVDNFNDSEFASVNGIFYDADDVMNSFYDVVRPNHLCIIIKNYMSSIKNKKKKKRKKRDNNG